MLLLALMLRFLFLHEPEEFDFLYEKQEQGAMSLMSSSSVGEHSASLAPLFALLESSLSQQQGGKIGLMTLCLEAEKQSVFPSLFQLSKAVFI